MNDRDEDLSSLVVTGLVDQLLRIIHKAVQIEEKPIDIGDNILLYPSEIHLIDLADRYPEDNISSLAKRLGVTKGAVSQIVTRLEKKGYLIKSKEDKNRKNIRIILTHRGKEAKKWHSDLHNRVNSHFIREFSSLDSVEREKVTRIFHALDQMMDSSMEIRDEFTREWREKKKKDSNNQNEV